MAALGSQSIASSYEQILQVDRDGGGNSTTHVSVKDGDNGTTFGFTIASDALMMSSTNRLEFGDTGTYIHQSADGVLDLVSDTEIEINATTIDMNGAVDISGNAQLSGTVTVGADGSGTDVIFYSGTAGDNLTWDASAEKLTITGTNGQTALDVADGNLVVADNIDCEGDIDINGTSNLDIVDIDGAVNMAADLTSTANIIIDADDKGLVLGADQDATIFSASSGQIDFIMGTPAVGTNEGLLRMNITDGGDTTLDIRGGEGGKAILRMTEDQGDDNADYFRMVGDSGNFTLETFASGSWANIIATSGSNGAVNMAQQPAFLVTNSSDPHVNFAIDTTITHTWNSEAFDQGGDFTSNTFTAPVTGKYQLSFHFYCQSIDSDSTGYAANIVTSNRTYSAQLTATMLDSDGTNVLSISVLADMDAGDSAYCTFRQDGGAQQSDGVTQSTFSGFLAC